MKEIKPIPFKPAPAQVRGPQVVIPPKPKKAGEVDIREVGINVERRIQRLIDADEYYSRD